MQAHNHFNAVVSHICRVWRFVSFHKASFGIAHTCEDDTWPQLATKLTTFDFEWGAKAPQGSLCAQACIARTAREHEALMVRNMMCNHTCSERPVPTCKTSIMVTATISIYSRPIRRKPQKRWRGRLPRHRFRGGAEGRQLCIMALHKVYRSWHHNACPACR